MRTRITLGILVILAATTPSAAASSSHRERLTISGTTIHGTERPTKLIAIGPIHGTGTVRFIEHGNTSDGTFYLPGGKVLITFTGTRFTAHRNPRACTATVEYHGTFTITGGTRDYRHAAGTGTFTEHRKYIGQRDSTGHCLPQAPPAIITAVNHARGTASL